MRYAACPSARKRAPPQGAWGGVRVLGGAWEVGGESGRVIEIVGGSSTHILGGALPLSWPRPTEPVAREPGGEVAELRRFGGRRR